MCFLIICFVLSMFLLTFVLVPGCGLCITVFSALIFTTLVAARPFSLSV